MNTEEIEAQAALKTKLHELLRSARDNRSEADLRAAGLIMLSIEYLDLNQWVQDDISDMYRKAFAAVTGGMLS